MTKEENYEYWIKAPELVKQYFYGQKGVDMTKDFYLGINNEYGWYRVDCIGHNVNEGAVMFRKRKIYSCLLGVEDEQVTEFRDKHTGWIPAPLHFAQRQEETLAVKHFAKSLEHLLRK